MTSSGRLAIEKLRRYRARLRASAASSSPTLSTFDQIWDAQTDGNEDLSELQLLDRPDRNCHANILAYGRDDLSLSLSARAECDVENR